MLSSLSTLGDCSRVVLVLLLTLKVGYIRLVILYWLLALCWCRVSNWAVQIRGARCLWSKQPLAPHADDAKLAWKSRQVSLCDTLVGQQEETKDVGKNFDKRAFLLFIFWSGVSNSAQKTPRTTSSSSSTRATHPPIREILFSLSLSSVQSPGQWLIKRDFLNSSSLLSS